MTLPKEPQYTAEHEWYSLSGGIAAVGTPHAWRTRWTASSTTNFPRSATILTAAE